MAKRLTRNISLPPRLHEFVARKVDGGDYDSASEVVREALRLMIDRERRRKELVRDLRAGLADVQAGRVLDGDAFMESIRHADPRAPRRRKSA